MIYFGGKIGKNYAWELTLFHKFREISDGISFFSITCNLDRFKGDHNPQFEFRIEIFNFYPIEFRVHNINHKE